MALENSHGLMELSTLENGEKTGLMARADSSTLMETSTMDSGLTIKQTGSEFISM
jgi:hypothetical protein